jgi:hypothetical protein
LPLKSEPQFEGFLQRIPPQLLDQYFQPQISAALVSQRPGCDIFDAKYEIAPINNVFIAEPAYTLPTCTLPEDTPCDEQFQNYITFNNSGLPINTPIGEYFSTNELCMFASGGGQCRQEIYTCDNGDTRQFWTKINL